MKAEIYARLKELLDAERTAALATVVAGEGLLGRSRLLASGDPAEAGAGGSPEREAAWGSLGDEALDREVDARARELMAERRSERFSAETAAGPVDVFVEVHQPPPRLVIIGAVHTARLLLRFARILGFHTTVIDPRGVFATEERFAEAHELVREWPREAFEHVPLTPSTAVVLLSHDAKLDLPALHVVLRRPVLYVGALGSSKTHAKRVAALEEAGYSAEEIGRIHAPVGLDLGGRRPEEIALAILAEIVAVQHGKGASLRGKS